MYDSCGDWDQSLVEGILNNRVIMTAATGYDSAVLVVVVGTSMHVFNL